MSQKENNAYQKLEQHFNRYTQLNSALSLLEWDRSVMMPPKAAEQRADQMATLAVMTHEIQSSAEVADLLAEAEQQAGSLTERQVANLRLMKWMNRHARALPSELVERKAHQEAVCESIWRVARETSDFNAVIKPFEDLIATVRETGEVKGDALGLTPYNALLDPYDPGNTSKNIDRVFDDVADFLPDFIGEVIEHQKSEPFEKPNGPFPVKSQQRLMHRLMDVLGFDEDQIRLDTSAHPFSTGKGNDLRITTRYDENDFMFCAMAVLHECGHSLFDRHCAPDMAGQPVSTSNMAGMTIHESQSLIIEKQLGRSGAFWQFVAPIVREALGRGEARFSAENLHRQATRVSRSLIRVDADEVTYPAHVIIRYRLEKALLSGDLAVKDLPVAWDDMMQKLIGITPPDLKRGCMQDIHWYAGSFGYFPTYALGAMTAAQFMQQAREDIKDLDDHVAAGNLEIFVNWLKTNIHEKAAQYTPNELVEKVTGRALDPSVFRAHLENRYLGKSMKSKRSVA